MWIIFSKYAPRQLKMAMTQNRKKICTEIMPNVEYRDFFSCGHTFVIFHDS